MKCPMHFINSPILCDCIEAECAWWDYEDNHCAVHAIPRAINLFSRTISGVADEFLDGPGYDPFQAVRGVSNRKFVDGAGGDGISSSDTSLDNL